MRVVACLAVAIAALALSEADARALSCAAPPEGRYSRYADVVFDGVLLSGPREQPLGRLVSPARMHVFRYLKGRGPSTVWIGTDVPVVVSGDDPGVVSTGLGLFDAYPGQIYRVYGDVPRGAGASTVAGVRTPHPCDGTYPRRTGSFLRGVPGSRMAERDAGGRRWAAELLRGAGGVRCVRVHPGRDPDQIECEKLDHLRHVAAALVPAGGNTWATGLAVAHPRLESIAVEGSFGIVERRAGRGGVALVVLPGYFEEIDVKVTARLATGATHRLYRFGNGVRVQDPQRPDVSWSFTRGGLADPSSLPTACIMFAQRPDASRRGDVVSLPRHGECGNGDHRFFAVRYVNGFDPGGTRRLATLVFGFARGVEHVTVTGPDGERVLPAGLFAAVYPPDVDHHELTVTFVRGGSGDETFRGRRDANVIRVPRSPLDSGL